MSEALKGIHHVTAIASDPQRNVDFYVGTLGLRLVKKTVNFDDPGTYHLYFGNEGGEPGTILTFFPWPGARRGQRGTGETVATAFSVPAGSLEFWQQRLAEAGVEYEAIEERFGDQVLRFTDPDRMSLELVTDASPEAPVPWEGSGASGIASKFAIRGFSGVTLAVSRLQPTSQLLTETLGYQSAGSDGSRHRFVAAVGGLATTVDVLDMPGVPRGRSGAGTVHHVAFRAADDAEQALWQRRLGEHGLRPTSVQDRQYFHSIYFREPGGVLFEIATDPPGFGFDESPAELGSGLKLPPWLEGRRSEIEALLPAVRKPGDAS